jgi:hypothetical protein
VDKNINEMKNLENNRLIAEFMNYNLEIVNNEVYFTHDDMLESLSDEELHFDTDWDWLMTVVDKIENYNEFTSVLFYPNSCTIIKSREFPADDNYFEISIDSFTKIDAVYNACVEFIKWYNKNK